MITYEQSRNALIPEATAIADRAVGKGPSPYPDVAAYESWAGRWNREFFAAMDRLCRERGVL